MWLITVSAHRPRFWPHRPAKKGAGVWNYSYTVWILGGRYLALFDERKYSCYRLITRSFSLLRRGCSLGQCSLPLVHLLTGGGARYVTVRSPSVDLDCSVYRVIRKQGCVLVDFEARTCSATLTWLSAGRITRDADARLRSRSAPGPPRSSDPLRCSAVSRQV